VEYVSEAADAKSWTGEVRLRDGRLPDVPAVARYLRECGAGTTLRGVEATVDGWLAEENGRLLLRVAGTGQTLRLAPLRRKVQWDVERSREQAFTGPERGAYECLRREVPGLCPPVRVTGPLVEGAAGDPYTLEVREFRWRG
jgi:hypothetical protein